MNNHPNSPTGVSCIRSYIVILIYVLSNTTSKGLTGCLPPEDFTSTIATPSERGGGGVTGVIGSYILSILVDFYHVVTEESDLKTKNPLDKMLFHPNFLSTQLEAD